MKSDAEAIFQILTDVRNAIPYELRPLQPEGTTIAMRDGETVDDFDLATVADGLERLTVELSDALDRAVAKLRADALRVYYAAEELARDPANAHLIPHVEAMRRAYEHDYGEPIPAK